MDKDSSYWNRFWEGPKLGLQWKHKVAAEFVASEPVVDIGCGSDFCWNFSDNEGSDRFSAATSRRATPSY